MEPQPRQRKRRGPPRRALSLSCFVPAAQPRRLGPNQPPGLSKRSP
jgi:hypothetical protein